MIKICYGALLIYLSLKHGVLCQVQDSAEVLGQTTSKSLFKQIWLSYANQSRGCIGPGNLTE
jgi:hypothetical protein